MHVVWPISVKHIYNITISLQYFTWKNMSNSKHFYKFSWKIKVFLSQKQLISHFGIKFKPSRIIRRSKLVRTNSITSISFHMHKICIFIQAV